MQLNMSAPITFINETDDIVRESYNESRSRKRAHCDAGDSDSDGYDGHDQKDTLDLIQCSRPTDLSLAAQQKDGPRPGKKTKGRVKIKMEFIENKLRRYTTFSKRKTGIMKKACELSTLTGTQVMLLVASETGHVYTFATRKLQPMVTSEYGKALIQTCLNSPDSGPNLMSNGQEVGDQLFGPNSFREATLNSSHNEVIHPSSSGLTSSDASLSADDVVEVRSPSARVSLGEQGAEDQALSLAESNVSSVIDNQAIFNEWTKLASQLKANNPILENRAQLTTTVNTSVQDVTGSSGQSIVYGLPVALNQFIMPDGNLVQNVSAANATKNVGQTMPVTLVAGGMSSNGPMLYQTPNGLIYAATGAVPSINGVPQIFNLPSVPPSNSIAVQNEQSGHPVLISLPLQQVSSSTRNAQQPIIVQQRIDNTKSQSKRR